MKRRVPKGSTSNGENESANYKNAVSLQHLTEGAYSYYLQILGQARIQFYISLALAISGVAGNISLLLINKASSPSLALNFILSPIFAYSCFQAGRILRRADEISRLILAISFAAKLIDDPELRNSTLSDLTTRLVVPYSSAARKGQKGKDTDELIAEIIEEHLKNLDQGFREAAKKDNFAA